MSLIHDVKQAIEMADKIGRSKKDYRQEGQNHYIHSHKSKDEVRKISFQFANYCRNQLGVNKLHKIEEKHFLAFMKSKEHLSLGYRRNIETNLRILEKGFLDRSHHLGKSAEPFCTPERVTPAMTRNEDVSDRSLSVKDIQAIKEEASENGRKAIDLMHHLGLRVSGATSVRVQNVHWDKNVVGVTEKGGRYREVPIPETFQDRLAHMVKGKEMQERLVPVQTRSVQDNLREAAWEADIVNYTGTHAFRHSYARERIETEMALEEKQLLHKCLERYSEGKKFDYAVRNKALYETMTAKVDQIHADLGHGEGRYDLALRYMA